MRSEDELKQAAADLAVQSVQSGMVVGLGSGSTAALAMRRLGEWLRAGRLRDILGIPYLRSKPAGRRCVWAYR